MDSSSAIKPFNEALVTWQNTYGRHDLPWQHNLNRYRVWISEVMLQQTQVNTVIPYYQRFMDHFPDVQTLSMASVDKVLALWSGLGYYRRGRFLWEAARVVMQKHHGIMPKKPNDLINLPGIGQSTAHAILSLADNQPFAILDGNVKRVLIRYAGLKTPWQDPKTIKKLWQLAEYLMPQYYCREYNQGLMDLGTSICKKSKPLCEQCPIQRHCQAHIQGITHLLPITSPRKPLPKRSQTLLVIKHRDHILVTKRPNSGIWPNLWSLPEQQIGQKDQHSIPKEWVISSQTLQNIKHKFTHFELTINPVLLETNTQDAEHFGIQGDWLSRSQINEYALAKPIKTLLQKLL
ncbi:MAG: A/G-specific adenine glycosylase [Pseudomonadota bacterium]|nr:A/G-specific adenine glycosylase [Pseudomonadota bacterium]